MIPSLSRKLRPLALLLALAPVGGAWAHAALLKSTPGSRATLRQPPRAIELWFNENVETSFSTIRVEDPSGQAVRTGTPESSPTEPNKLSVSLPALAPGTYTVHYRVLSQDGHLVEYGYRFRIEAAAASQ
ncbi:hypothetical protein SAMN04488038_104147 [Solimonas aquatica]|uniref:Copper resistance protein C n=1 Tax=Solimonas aquatica TaxID=489703 RepID=A0A1H9DS69_9GAMM|nr:copper resistance CopC family protein [Solimonas aquatica]SEQ16319.1 hypothetical protein SAMN04488038_104147 [Solimonas aquatica]